MIGLLIHYKYCVPRPSANLSRQAMFHLIALYLESNRPGVTL
jgi:hypothetical protein